MEIPPREASLLSIIATCIVAYKDKKAAKESFDQLTTPEVIKVGQEIINKNYNHWLAKSYLEWADKRAGTYKVRCPHCNQIMK